MTQGFRAQVERLSKAIPGGADGDKRRAAIGSWAAMIGAVILARAIDDPELSDEVLGETRAWINAGLERSEEHTSELQSLMRISYAAFCLKKKIHSRTSVSTQF